MSITYYRTDWREYRFGALPDDFSVVWRSSRWYIDGVEVDPGFRAALQTPGTTSLSAIVWTITSDGSDCEVFATFAPLSGAPVGTVAIDVGGSAGTESAYVVIVDVSDNLCKVAKYVAGAYSELLNFAFTYEPPLDHCVRFQRAGGVLNVKIWQQYKGETPTWHTVTDASPLPRGYAGIVTPVGYPGTYRYLAVATGPMMSQTVYSQDASTMPPRVWDSVDDPTINLEYTLQVECLNPSSRRVENYFFSNRAHATDKSDFPSSYDMQPFLVNAGQHTHDILGDDLFNAGDDSSASSNQVTLQTYTNRLQFFKYRSFSGRRLMHRIGVAGAPHRQFEVLRAYVSDGEPVRDGLAAGSTVSSGQAGTWTFTPIDAGGRLSQELAVSKYIGSETCLHLITGVVSVQAPLSLAYNLTSFVIQVRFILLSAPPTTDAVLIVKKATHGILWNFYVYIEKVTGRVGFYTSVASTNQLNALTSTVNYCDGKLHTVVVGVSSLDREYLMIDNVVIDDRVPDGVCDSSSATVAWGQNLPPGSEIFDYRIYGAYFNPDEMRAISAQIPDSSTLNLVAWWLHNDTAGSTVTDYSPTANNASIFGVESTDFNWAPTFQGTAQFAGKYMPMIHGLPFNVLLDNIDPNRNIFRLNDRALTFGVPKLFAKGVRLIAGTDYADLVNGCYQMVATQSEPVTAWFDPTPDAVDTSLLALVFHDALSLRSPLADVADIDALGCSAVSRQLPYRSGVSNQGSKMTGGDLAQSVLGNAGATYRYDRHGRVTPGFLLPPINPGPYGLEPCLEFLAYDAAYVEYPNLTFPGSSYTVSFWVKSLQLSNTVSPFPDTDGLVSPINVVNTILSIFEDGIAGMVIGQDSSNIGAVKVHQEGILGDLSTLPGTLKYNEWKFFAFVLDSVGGIFSAYSIRADRTVVLSASTTVLTAPSFSTKATIKVGENFVGSVRNMRIDSAVLDVATLQAIVNAPEDYSTVSSSVIFYDTLSSNSGATTIEARGKVGQIYGCRWVPKESYDLTVLSSATLADRNMRPAYRVDINYRLNQKQLADGDILGTATPTDRTALKSTVLSVSYNDPEIQDNYPGSRDVSLDTALQLRADAATLNRDLIERLAEYRVLADLVNSGRRTIKLAIFDEVWVTAGKAGFENGVSMRVIQIILDLSNIANSVVGLWGGEPPPGGFLTLDTEDLLFIQGNGDLLKLED